MRILNSMEDLKGCFLESTAVLDNTVFERSLIFITEHDQNGAVGFIINHLHPRKLNQLVEFRHAAAIDLYTGGPVATEEIFFLHSSYQDIGGLQVDENIYLGGNFQTAVEHLSNGQLSFTEIKIFIGYCGWNAHELEAEIKEGSWRQLNWDPGRLFLQ